MMRLAEPSTQMSALSGDVLVAFTEEGSPDSSDEEQTTLRVALSGGGTGIHAHLRTKFATAGSNRAALAVEVI